MMMMMRERIGMREELIKKASSLSMKAHNNKVPYLVEKSRGSPEVLFCFAGSLFAGDWFCNRKPFGETNINTQLFPSIRSIGNNEIAVVNEAFLRRFEAILTRSSFQNEVEKAEKEKKQIVFAGYSSGGPIAILATLWFLENCLNKPDTNQNQNQSQPPVPPQCATFGSPLFGGKMFPHAIRRENWSQYFIHFVMKHDIVPRISLTSLSSIEPILQTILNLFNSKPTNFHTEYIPRAREASAFYTTVTRSASSVSSHDACILMGSTNLLLATITSFVELSPYRPFGTYVFCDNNEKLLTVVRNPDAVLQLLFYCMQLNDETESVDAAAYRSLGEHLAYESLLKQILEMQCVDLDHLDELPLSSDGGANYETAKALDDLGLSTRGRLCLRAAGELEKQKVNNQEKIDAKKSDIEKGLHWLEGYRAKSKVNKGGYYDAFKLQSEEEDFKANVKRLELAGIWDEIVEMLKRYELPDGFECRKEWIMLGTRYRRIVEPLDIANYYRHSMNEDTGPYLERARPRRYRYTQRWHEHALRKPAGFSSEICFWAELEELSLKISRAGSFENVKERVLLLEEEVSKWVCGNDRVCGDDLRKDVLLEESSFMKWWKTLPNYHRSGSCIAGLINK